MKKIFFKHLNIKKRKITGRTSFGNLVLYNRGGEHKKIIRIIDIKNYIWYIKGWILTLDYDPIKNTLINLVLYLNGLCAYSLAIKNVFVGYRIWINFNAYLTIGDKTTLQFVNNKIVVSNLELYNKKYVQYVKTNNNFAKIIIKLLKFSLIKLKSKIIIKINNYNIITLGSIYNYDNLAYKKASSFRYQGWRPHVRGVAKNPVDHPLGGGQGKTSGGRPSCNFKGNFLKGQKTRKKNRYDKINLKR